MSITNVYRHATILSYLADCFNILCLGKYTSNVRQWRWTKKLFSVVHKSSRSFMLHNLPILWLVDHILTINCVMVNYGGFVIPYMLVLISTQFYYISFSAQSCRFVYMNNLSVSHFLVCFLICCPTVVRWDFYMHVYSHVNFPCAMQDFQDVIR